MSAAAVLDEPWRIGSTTPRLLMPPLAQHVDETAEHGIKPEATWGYDCIAFLTIVLGWTLLPWQRWLYAHALEKRADGTGFRFQTIVILIARQQGKTKWLRGLGLWRLYLSETGASTPWCPGAKTAIIAAQNLAYAENTLKEVVDDLREHPLLSRELVNHRVVNGAHKAILTNNRTWRAVTATRKGGRSLSVDLAILDELRELTNWEGWNAITHATTMRPNAQIVCASNAGDARSEVLASLRNASIAKIDSGDSEDSTVGFFEWSVPPEADPTDEKFWYMANPSLGLLNDFTIETLRGFLEVEEKTNLAGFQTESLALDINTPILTTNGWKTIGTVQVGDQVYSPDGHPITITHVTAVRHDRPCFEVETIDGRTVVADADHQWMVEDRRRIGGKRKQAWEVASTAELVRRGLTRNKTGGSFAYRLPRQHSIISKPVALPIDPYVLGAWLGDGSATKAEIACIDSDADEFTAHLGVQVTSTRLVGNLRYINFRITPRKSRNGFPARCRELGIWEASDKHIPEQYLTAGTEQRLALLQGLCDTDGSIDEKNGVVRFASSRRRLADQVLYLARSLGFRATLRVQKPAKDSRLAGGHLIRANGPSYHVGWTQDAADPAPFRLSRKLAKIGSRPSRAGERTTISIRNITAVPSRPVRCITVDSDDSLFLAGRDLIPTHNCQWVDSIVPGKIPAEHWAATRDPDSRRAQDATVYACVDVNYDRSRAYVAIAARREDGNVHTEVVAAARGTDWVIPWLKARTDRFAGIAVQEIGAPASSLIIDMEAAKLKVVKWGPAKEVQAGCSLLYDGIVNDHSIYHRPQPLLDKAATSGAARHSGDAWIWDRRSSPIDVSPMVACTGAVWLEASRFKVKTPEVHGWDADKIRQWEREAIEKKQRWEREAQERWGMTNSDTPKAQLKALCNAQTYAIAHAGSAAA
ncbi:LAGLIDADG family homing endonuclease [Mycolicibacterium sphagni]|uniref:LAGLIDADG family homing endonuclease n=1 Tax=Mycolicibacterium sphagni TaxID=1786 RepID=UPI0021F2F4C4|nr:LAGLIDADG family homing endonuclease [Mycolicibacterium sphagni]MCV7174924.1 hypothetical protein [Mycolicibacterium sphagni]